MNDEKKKKSLKYLNVPWITIQQTSFKTSSRGLTSRPHNSISDYRSIHEKTFSPFRNSNTKFTTEEIRIIDNDYSDSQNRVKLTRNPSKLIQLQTQQELRNLERSRTKNISKETILLTPSTPQISHDDSFISVSSDENEFESDDDLKKLSQEFQIEFINKDYPPDVTINDIKDQIWSYCKKKKIKKKEHINEIPGQIINSNNSNVFKLNDTKGTKKLKKVISIHSSLEDSNQVFSTSLKNKKLEINLQDKLKDCLTVLEYQEFLEKNNLHKSGFIKNIEVNSKSFNSPTTPKTSRVPL